ncbi:MAG: YcjF family protein [Clostridia bacterium]|nr:YcjF family protein [Clostridia bacterium]
MKENNTAKKNDVKTGSVSDIYEYEQKYVKKENSKSIRFFLRLIIIILAVAVFACLFSVGYRLYEIFDNKYVGYGIAAIFLVLYIVLFIVPVVKIMRSDYFKVNVNSETAGEAKRHNKKVREDIAKKIVDFNAEVDNAGWYDGETVDRLGYALSKNDNEGIKECLTALYGGSVKKSARSIIAKSSVKAGLLSAISQSKTLDTALITAVNLQMIKDIIFLYGFRPTDARLVRIFGAVMADALVAYGLGSINIGKGVAKTVGEAAKGIPVLGQALSILVDSSVQGLVNGTLTAVIGFQTIRYLNYEYKLQNILDGVVLVEEGEEKEIFEELEDTLKKAGKKKSTATV